MHHDPFFEREKEKYANPVPSRESILNTLEELGCPVTQKKLEGLFDIQSEEQSQALTYRLKAMMRDAQLMLDRRGRYCLLKRLTLIAGRVHGHPDGFGFLTPEDGTPDLFLAPKEMRSVMHGDRVLARKGGQDYRGRDIGVIHEVLERRNKTVVGKIFKEHDLYFLEPDSKHLPNAIYIPKEALNSAQPNQIVLAEITDFPTNRIQAIGRVVEVLGDPMAAGMEINVAIHAHNLPAVWPENVVDELSKFSEKSKASENLTETKDRTDLRHLPFVTIDGEDAKDFDDAVYAEPKKRSQGAWRLFVAIADVSHYVKPNTALDEEALNRGNSVYFPGRVIPMLPELLSDDLCSLKPKVDRLCMVCEMSISAEGQLERYRFYRAIIHSNARLTYTEVAAILENSVANVPEQILGNGHSLASTLPSSESRRPSESAQEHSLSPAIYSNLNNLFGVYKVLLAARQKRGALDFETMETRIIFDEHKKIKTICPTERNIAHRLIEEAMLAANVATARFILKHKIPALFRVHAEPKEEKMRNLREFLEELAVPFTGAKKVTPQHYHKTLAFIESRPDRHLIQTVMLRSMNQAQYSEENIGHFGLAYPAYTHFTSPIRRYPDLLTHRAIGWILEHHEVSDYAYTLKQMKTIGQYCSETERRADEATREVVAWLKCEYLQDKLGQEFSGRISSVTGFGIFVELDQIYVEGLVHVTGLKNDYYRFDASKHRLIGERTHMVYRLGDKVNVRVARVNLDERKIDFDLI